MLQMLTVYLEQYLRREEGQDLIEYALLVGLISIVAVVAITQAGVDVNRIWTAVSAALAGVP